MKSGHTKIGLWDWIKEQGYCFSIPPNQNCFVEEVLTEEKLCELIKKYWDENWPEEKRITMPKKYWVIQSPGNIGVGDSNVMIDSIERAEDRATDLSNKNPGVRFVILEAVKVVYRDFPAPVIEEMK